MPFRLMISNCTPLGNASNRCKPTGVKTRTLPLKQPKPPPPPVPPPPPPPPEPPPVAGAPDPALTDGGKRPGTPSEVSIPVQHCSGRPVIKSPWVSTTAQFLSSTEYQ